MAQTMIVAHKSNNFKPLLGRKTGYAHLGEGGFQKADSLYAQAASRYGPDAEGAGLLRDLVRKGVVADEAERILSVYFGVRE